MSDEKTLTKDIAGHFMADNRSVDLNEFTSIEDEAAHMLGSYQKTHGAITLKSLEELSVSAAKDLAKFGGILLLDISKMSDNAVAELCKASASSLLYLFGVHDLTERRAEILSSYKGDLVLADLNSIGEAVAKNLCKQTGSLSIGGVEELSPELCQILSRHQGSRLSFDALVLLSSESAKFLSAYDGELHLDNITQILDGTAEWLSKKKGDSISLRGLKAITRKTQALLEECEVEINTSWDQFLPSFDCMQDICEHFSYSMGGGG